MPHSLQLLAGPAAMSLLRERDLRAADVDVVAGASGGPKWLVLAGLDRVIFPWLRDAARDRPLHLIGSSIGSWRMACLAQDDPLAAIARLENAYIQQHYSARPSPAEVSRVGNAMLKEMLGGNGAREILANGHACLHVVTARCNGLIKSERKPLQLGGLALAALANAVSRKTLCWQMERVIFDNAGEHGPFRGLADMPTRHVALTGENLHAALMASGSIPLVLEGVRIPGAPDEIYRDGGLLDYHLDLDYGQGSGLVLYPHFYPHLIPGWFDKSLSWRRARGANLDRVLLLAPTREFIERIPGGRIPNRKDFYRYEHDERVRVWRGIVDASRRLGDEFMELLESGQAAAHAQPLY